MPSQRKRSPLPRPTPIPVAGLIAFVACAQPPEGSRELTQEEERVVQVAIDELDVTTPVAEILLDKANPLFDRNGRSIENNAELAPGLHEILDKIHDVSDGGRILISDAEHISWAAAHGSGSDGLAGDDYILIRETEDGGGILVPGFMLAHEGAHYIFGPHRWAAGSEADRRVRGDLADQLVVGLEKKDLPYTLQAFYILGGLWYGSADWSRRDTETVIEQQLPVVDEQTAQVFIDEQRRMLEEELNRETWARDMADYAVRTYGNEDSDLLGPLGITQAELEETLMEADELYEIQRENTEAALEALREAEAELHSEARSEVRGHRRVR